MAKYTASVFSTEPAWLAYVQVGTSPSQAVSVAKKNFHQLILPQELVVKSPSNSEEVWKGLLGYTNMKFLMPSLLPAPFS